MYRNAIPDILPGSTWIAVDGSRAIVRTAAARYVSFMASGIMAPPVHESAFRARFQPLYDRAAVRSQFSMSLANLGEFRVYWLPERRRIVARSVCCTRHFAVPEGAQLVGTFADPCKADAFFEALDVVVRMPAEEARKARAA